MSIDAMRWALMQHGISSPQKFVLVVLADRANEFHECWPSVDRLSLDTELDPRTVQRALGALEEIGLIKTQSRPGRSNVFRLIGVMGREDETPRQKTSFTKKASGAVPPQAESHPRQSATPDTVPPQAESHPRQSATPLSTTPPAESHPCQTTAPAVSLTPPAESRGGGDSLPPRTISEPKRAEREKACRSTPRSRAPRKFHSRLRGDKPTQPLPAEQNQTTGDHDGKKPYGDLNNVWLSDSEFEFLSTSRGKQLTIDAINQVSLYKAEHGKEFSSDLAALIRWGYAAASERQAVKAQQDPAIPAVTLQPSSCLPPVQAWELSDPDIKTPGMAQIVRNALNGDEDARNILESRNRPRS